MFHFANDNAEWVRLKSLALLAVRPLWQRYLICVLHYIIPHFQGDDAIRWYFGQGMLVTVVASCHAALHFLVLAQTWNFCSGKPSPEALPKEYIPLHRIHIWVVWWSQCHVRLDEWHSHVNCFWRCETARRLAAASTCNGRTLHGYRGQKLSHH